MFSHVCGTYQSVDKIKAFVIGVSPEKDCARRLSELVLTQALVTTNLVA
jgi:hypothetical protein